MFKQQINSAFNGLIIFLGGVAGGLVVDRELDPHLTTLVVVIGSAYLTSLVLFRVRAAVDKQRGSDPEADKGPSD